MTAHQYGTLKYIYSNNIFLSKEAKSLHMGTIGSLIKRGWIYHSSGLLKLTEAGLEEYDRYRKPQANFRQHEYEISDYIKSLLHINQLISKRKAS
jgi:hypothetical protein